MAINGTGVQVRIGVDTPTTPATRWNIADYTVTEDSTPLDPADSTGGYGQISVDLRDEDIKRVMGQELALTDGVLGETIGTIRELGGNGLVGKVTANSRLAQLAVERTIQPFAGTLGDCLEYHFELCGLVDDVAIDNDFYAVNVKVPGGRENVHVRMRQLAAAYNFELSLVNNKVVVRHPHEYVAVNYRNADVSWSLSQDGLARAVSGWSYNTTSGYDIAYPIRGDAANADVFQVDAGETKVYTARMDASLSSIDPLTLVDGASYPSATGSAYAVSTMDGATISPQAWTTSGGSVQVEISEDTKLLTFTVRGADIPSLSPFRVATPDGSGGYTSAIRIRGNGVFWEKSLMTLYIGDDADLAPDEMGIEVDNQFMETADQLYHRLLRSAARYGTDRQTVQVSTGGVNRLGDSGELDYATIGDVKAAYPGATIGSIKLALGPTIADWNAAARAMVVGNFENQAFGNINGARVHLDHSWYRIRSATIGARRVSYGAERDNTVGDVYRTGETIAQWNTRFAGRKIRDVNIAPLIEESTF